MKRTRHCPRLEPLENKALLSAVDMMVTASEAPVLLLPKVAHHQIALNGSVSGPWTVTPGIPDIGSSQTLTGSGTVKPLGQVSASGTLHLTGFIAVGHATGTLTLTNARGSVTLQLTGKPQRGFSGPPMQLTFKIVKATGHYAGSTGSGTAMLTEVVADAVPPVSTSTPTNLPIIIGPIFNLTLHSA
jgi:hypothetical protein